MKILYATQECLNGTNIIKTLEISLIKKLRNLNKILELFIPTQGMTFEAAPTLD